MAVALAIGGVAVGCGLVGLAVVVRRVQLGESHNGLEAERELLDRGAVLLTELTKAVAETDSDDRARLSKTDAWETLGRDLAVFQGHLSLSFDQRSAVVAAFDDAVQLTDWRTSWVGELGYAGRSVEDVGPRSRHRAPDDALAELVDARQRYLTAARAHLRRRPLV